MKTINSIIVIVLFGFLTFQGLNLVMQEAVSKGNLNDENLAIVNVYDNDVTALKSNISKQKGQLELSSQTNVDSNGIDQFFREYSEAKSKLNTFKDGVYLIFSFPSLVLVSVPFLNAHDIENYEIAINVLVYLSVIVAIWAAWFRKEVTK